MSTAVKATATAPSTASTPTTASLTESAVPPRINVVRLCGTSWAPCGYCKGSRAHLSQMNTRDSSPANFSSDDPNIAATEVESSKSYSVVASHLTPALYEQFLASGWRRSGVALYKPMNWETCCPALTIRLAAAHYQPTKSQRKVLKRMHAIRHPTSTGTTLPTKEVTSSHGKRIKTAPTSHDMIETSMDDSWVDTLLHQSGVLERLSEATRVSLQQCINEIEQTSTITRHDITIPTIRYKVKATRRDPKSVKEAVRVEVISTVCATVAGQSHGRHDRGVLVRDVAGRLRHSVDTMPPGTDFIQVSSVQGHEPSGHVIVQLNMSKPTNGLHSHGASNVNGIHTSTNDTNTTSIDSDRFRSWWMDTQPSGTPPEPPYELVVTTVPAHESALDPRVHQLYWDYQHVVHNDPNPLHSSVTDNVTQENEALAFYANGTDVDQDAWGRDYAPLGWRERALDMLSKEYRHLPEATRTRLIRSFTSFYEFLVENPFLTPEASTAQTGTSIRTGTYHQHYTMSGNVLVAVGVVDVLPSGLSSVYLFYSPRFAHELVPLGKYAILKEIEWTQQAGLSYYYLGYYIESCPKMVYKGDYRPSELLCPTTNQWVDSEEGKATLRRESPEYHCCRLYKGQDSTSSVGSSDPVRGKSKAISKIRMDVGVPSLVSLSMLHTDGQALVRPFLVEFMDHICPEIALQCTVSFR